MKRIGVVLSLILAVYSCTNVQNNSEKENKIIGMANPASVFCIEKGGESVIRKDENGNEYGICVFKDGKEIEEWEFYRANN